MSERGPGMKVTTIRFGNDLMELLQAEAGRDGVSVSQYVREAALARAAAAAAARDGAVILGAPPASSDAALGSDQGRAGRDQASVSAPRTGAAETLEEAAALRAESKQALARARNLRERIDRQRQQGKDG